MKKCLVVFLVLAATSGYAQGIQLGIKGGVNVSNYTGGNIQSDALVGFHVGGLMNILLSKNFAISPEVLLSSQGAKVDNAGNKNNLSVYYVNVPVMAKLIFDGGLYIEAGPQIGFKASEDADLPNQTIDNFAKNIDLNVGAGLGYHSRSGFGLGARYMAGLSKVGDFNAGTTSPDFKNSVIQVSLFWTLFNNDRK